jgi:uncharacterized cupin superfamily protein
MQQTSNGFRMWSVWQPDRNLFFNSYLAPSDDGNLVVDPLPFDEATAAELEQLGGVAWVVVTNRDHERATADVVRRFGAKVAAGGDAASFETAVDRVLGDGDEICGATVVALEGLKTPGEIALFFPSLAQTVLVGDALWGDPAGSLRLMPDGKLADPVRAALSLRRLRALRPKHVLVGDGAPVFEAGFEALNACLEARNDAHVNVINLDELAFKRDPDDPPGYRGEWSEIGLALGATKLGYAAARLRPGEAFCPNHWHTMEEELFIVWEGKPMLRTPRGETRLRTGDLVAFPTSERGAHKVWNDTNVPCTIVMIANEDENDVCIYPDSDKIGISALHRRLRGSPHLTYYDGEL